MSQTARWDLLCSTCDLRVGACRDIHDKIEAGASMPEVMQMALNAGMDSPDMMRCFGWPAAAKPVPVMQMVGPAPRPTGALKNLIAAVKREYGGA